MFFSMIRPGICNLSLGAARIAKKCVKSHSLPLSLQTCFRSFSTIHSQTRLKSSLRCTQIKSSATYPIATPYKTPFPLLLSRGFSKETYPSIAGLKGCVISEKVDDFQTIVLSDSVKKELIARLSEETLSPYTYYFELMGKLEKIGREVLPIEIQNILKEMAVTHSPQMLYFKNCPINPNLGPTPDEDRHNPFDIFIEEYFLLMLTGLKYCKPYHERLEKAGEIISQVRPVKGYENKANSRGSGLPFPLHTEQNHMYGVFEFLSLLCKKGDPNAATEFVSANAFLKGIPDWVIEGMKKPIFKMKPGELWKGSHIPLIAPILEKDFNGGYNIRFNSDLRQRVVPITPEASKVNEFLEKHLLTVPKRKVFLKAGECINFSNIKMLHGRCAYTPSTTHEQRRDLIRIYEEVDWFRLFHEVKKDLPVKIVSHG